MTVKELREALAQYPDGMEVLLASQDTGYHSAGKFKVVRVALNARDDTGWSGPHMDPDLGHEEDAGLTDALWLDAVYARGLG